MLQTISTLTCKSAFIFVLMHIQIPLHSAVWNGSVSNDWHDAANWNTGIIPGISDDVIIPLAALRMPYLTGNISIQSMSTHDGTNIIIDTFALVKINNLSGYGLRLEGGLENYGHLIINAQEEGITQEMNTGQIINYGIIEVSSSTSIGIDYHAFHNRRFAITKVSSPQSIGMNIRPTFTNEGSIEIDTALTIGISLKGSALLNDCLGLIEINNCNVGLSIIGNMRNSARMIIKNVNTGIRHYKSMGIGALTNPEEELIVIENFRDTGIVADELNNAGYIELNTYLPALGISVQSAQIFNSSGQGQINLYGTDLTPIDAAPGGIANIDYLDHRIHYANRLDWNYNRNEYYREVDSLYRNFLIHIPEAYDSSRAIPLVLMLHGSSGDGTKFYNISGWKEKADQDTFIVVFPTSQEHYVVEKSRCSTKWSSDGLSSEIDPNAPIRDDIPFLIDLIDLCKNTFNINADKIYQGGFSNGGGFTKSRSLMEMNNIYAATFASGGLGLPQEYQPDNGIFLPHFEIIGNLDDNILERLNRTTPFDITTDSIFSFEELSTPISNLLEALQLDTTFTSEFVPGTYNILTYSDDLSGQGNEYKAWIIDGLEHEFPNGDNHPIKAVDTIWPWLKQWSKN